MGIPGIGYHGGTSGTLDSACLVIIRHQVSYFARHTFVCSGLMDHALHSNHPLSPQLLFILYLPNIQLFLYSTEFPNFKLSGMFILLLTKVHRPTSKHPTQLNLFQRQLPAGSPVAAISYNIHSPPNMQLKATSSPHNITKAALILSRSGPPHIRMDYAPS